MVCQVDASKKPHVLWPMKYFAKAVTNLYLLKCKLLQEDKILSSYFDIRYKHVNENLEEGVVKIIFITSVENDSNILTKNISA